MAKKIWFGTFPGEHVFKWFEDHVGPRTHYIHSNIGGRGWRFEFEEVPRHLRTELAQDQGWYLTVDDEKTLTYYLLMR